MLIAAVTEKLTPEMESSMLIVTLSVFALLPLAIITVLRAIRRVERDGPRVRRDLFKLPDIIALTVIMGLLFAPVVFNRITAMLKPETAATSPPAPEPPKVVPEVDPITKAPLHPPLPAPAPAEAPIDASQMFVIMLASCLPTIGLMSVFVMRGARLRDLFGLDQMPFLRACFLGLGLGLLAYSLTFVVNLVTVNLTSSTEAPQKLVQTFSGAVTAGDYALLLALTVSAVVAAPICEEILFRGAFYPILSRFTGRLFSAWFTALIFGLIHDTFTAIPSLAVLALCLTLAYEVTGSLLVPMALHASFNALNLLLTLWFSHLGHTV